MIYHIAVQYCWWSLVRSCPASHAGPACPGKSEILHLPSLLLAVLLLLLLLLQFAEDPEHAVELWDLATSLTGVRTDSSLV